MSEPVMYEWSPTENSIVERALSPHPFHPLSAQQMLQQDESMVQSSSSGIVRHPVFSNSTNCYTNFLPNIEPMVPLSLAEVNNIHLGKEVKCEIDPPNDTANNSDDSYSGWFLFFYISDCHFIVQTIKHRLVFVPRLSIRRRCLLRSHRSSAKCHLFVFFFNSLIFPSFSLLPICVGHAFEWHRKRLRRKAKARPEVCRRAKLPMRLDWR